MVVSPGKLSGFEVHGTCGLIVLHRCKFVYIPQDGAYYEEYAIDERKRLAGDKRRHWDRLPEGWGRYSVVVFCISKGPQLT